MGYPTLTLKQRTYLVHKNKGKKQFYDLNEKKKFNQHLHYSSNMLQ